MQKDTHYHDFLTEGRGSSRANQEAQPACFTQSAHRNPVGTVSSETKQDAHMKVTYSVHNIIGFILKPLVKVTDNSYNKLINLCRTLKAMLNFLTYAR